MTLKTVAGLILKGTLTGLKSQAKYLLEILNRNFIDIDFIFQYYIKFLSLFSASASQYFVEDPEKIGSEVKEKQKRRRTKKERNMILEKVRFSYYSYMHAKQTRMTWILIVVRAAICSCSSILVANLFYKYRFCPSSEIMLDIKSFTSSISSLCVTVK